MDCAAAAVRTAVIWMRKRGPERRARTPDGAESGRAVSGRAAVGAGGEGGVGDGAGAGAGWPWLTQAVGWYRPARSKTRSCQEWGLRPRPSCTVDSNNPADSGAPHCPGTRPARRQSTGRPGRTSFDRSRSALPSRLPEEAARCPGSPAGSARGSGPRRPGSRWHSPAAPVEAAHHRPSWRRSTPPLLAGADAACPLHRSQPSPGCR